MVRRNKALLTDEQLNAMSLSKLLTIGLKDLRRQEKAKNSEVRMHCWLEKDDGICVACLAGSVMRFSCGRTYQGLSFAPTWATALNCLRIGEVKAALGTLGRDGLLGDGLNRRVVDYVQKSQGAGWWRQMGKLLKDLKKTGL